MIGPVLFLLAQAAASAEPPTRVGKWEVAQRESSCTIATLFRSGALVRIEYFPREDDYFLLLADPAWPQIVDGQHYPIDIQGNRNVLVTLEGVGLREEGASHMVMYVPVVPRLYRRGMLNRDNLRGLSPANTNVRFETILLDGQEITISGGDRPRRTLRLSDTVPAFRALAQCADRLAPGQNASLTGRLRTRGIQ
jgi:hypothetical protein